MASISVQNERQIRLIFGEQDAGKRVDKALSDVLEDVSRATIQSWIRSGNVRLDGQTCKPRDAVAIGQAIVIEVPAVQPIPVRAESMVLDIVHEDEALLVINKPAGLVVHPGAGNTHNTLLNGLLAYHAPLEYLARGGIVHRLDKLTSGLMVVAKTEAVRQHLVKQLSERSVKREYQALVYGKLVAGGTINQAIGRHPVERKKMAVRADGKPAITHYRIAEKFRSTTLLKVSLETGRTHQIRVHLSFKGLPLVGDPVYGRRLQLPTAAGVRLQEAMRSFRRQALHARTLGLIHPLSKQPISWQVTMPADMRALYAALKADTRTSAG